MFTQAVLEDTLRGIKELSKIEFLRRSYLAGGTALALQIGHRISVDLDFFTKIDFDEQEISIELRQLKELRIDRTAYKTVKGQIGETNFSLFYYPYEMVEVGVGFEGITLASKKDVAAMKIHALEDRGARRDFIDAFFLTKEFSVEQMLEFYDHKYKCLDDHLYTIIKSLSYFAEADEDDYMPRMLVEVKWEEVKKFFVREAMRLAKVKGII